MCGETSVGSAGGVDLGRRRQAVGWEEEVTVVTCETEGADCFAAAMAAGDLVTLDGITSVAKSLGADRVSEVRRAHRGSAVFFCSL